MTTKHVVIAAIIFSVLGAYLRWPITAVKTPSDIKNFPQAVGVWQGGPEPEAIQELTGLGAEGLVSMKYRSPEKATIDFHLATLNIRRRQKSWRAIVLNDFCWGTILWSKTMPLSEDYMSVASSSSGSMGIE